MPLNEEECNLIVDFLAEEDIASITYFIASYKRMKETLVALKEHIEILDDTGDLD